MEERIKKLENEIIEIKERNKRVEKDKKWETSLFRKILIAFTTYILMCLVMYSIGVKDFYINAIVPTLGFLLSTISFSFIKDWWIKEN